MVKSYWLIKFLFVEAYGAIETHCLHTSCLFLKLHIHIYSTAWELFHSMSGMCVDNGYTTYTHIYFRTRLLSHISYFIVWSMLLLVWIIKPTNSYNKIYTYVVIACTTSRYNTTRTVTAVYVLGSAEKLPAMALKRCIILGLLIYLKSWLTVMGTISMS